MTDRTVARYRIVEQIGAGGMEVVYRAEDVGLRGTLALEFPQARGLAEEEVKERFVRYRSNRQ